MKNTKFRKKYHKNSCISFRKHRLIEALKAEDYSVIGDGCQVLFGVVRISRGVFRT